jgi:drug/metabolite transporter (DMT)-like permease
MALAALMWSMAGLVTRQLETARGFELTFWRSSFNSIALILILGTWHGWRPLLSALTSGARALWLSSACWCVMYTAFMLALSLTTVANVLVTLALAPLFTALVAWVTLRHRLPVRTWIAVVVAGVGIGWMFWAGVGGREAKHLWGVLVAMGVPLAAAVNWTLLQHLRGRAGAHSMLHAVLLGAILSALLTLPLALPFTASAGDVAWLAALGVVQLAIPCLLAVWAARSLSAPECSLLALLEVVFGVAWAWLGAGEAPSGAVLGGGALVLLALAGNEVPALVRRR